MAQYRRVWGQVVFSVWYCDAELLIGMRDEDAAVGAKMALGRAVSMPNKLAATSFECRYPNGTSFPVHATPR